VDTLAFGHDPLFAAPPILMPPRLASRFSAGAVPHAPIGDRDPRRAAPGSRETSCDRDDNNRRDGDRAPGIAPRQVRDHHPIPLSGSVHTRLPNRQIPRAGASVTGRT
jgi:hypothetical protein